MNNSQIIPEKVTRPIQLLAAWLTGLIIINGAFLITATQMTSHPWASGALVIAAIVNVPLFLISIFLLQTRYRPEMQEDVYYSKYLEHQYSSKTDKPDLPEIDELSKNIADEIVNKLEPLPKGKTEKGQTEVVEKIVRKSQLEQITRRLGDVRTLSELYLSPNTWVKIVRQWKEDPIFKDEIERLKQEHLIEIENYDIENSKLTNLGMQVAKNAQEKGILWQQTHEEYWNSQHRKRTAKSGG
jgi:hypothetical protein